jgi:hypothetical protein
MQTKRKLHRLLDALDVACYTFILLVAGALISVLAIEGAIFLLR